jgi:hypothetical protein
MDPNELQAVSEALDQLRQGGTVSAETLAKLGGTTQSANKAMDEYKKKILGIGSAIGGMAKTIADGEGTFKSLGSTVSGLATVFDTVASKFGIFGSVMGGLAKGVAEAANFVLDRLDVVAKSYQAMGDASAGAVDGIDGLMRQFNQLGNYSLTAFGKAVKANTMGLMTFRGTAAAGAEELSKVAGVLTTNDPAKKFLKLGISLDEVGDTTAQYVADFSRFGLLQGETTDQLIKKTQNYIYEVDLIARLTGQSRAEQQKATQQLMADSQARSVLGQMAADGQEEAAEELAILMKSFDASTNAILRAGATGIPLTQEAQKASVYTNNVLIETSEAVKRREISAAEGVTRINKALAQGADNFRGITAYSKTAFGDIVLAGEDASAAMRARAKFIKDHPEYAGLSDLELAKKQQELQRDASGKLTEEFTDAQLATADASKGLQSLGFSLAVFAVPAVNKFTNVLNDAVGFVNEKIGIGGKYSTPLGVNRGPAGGARAGGGLDPQLKSAVDSAIKEYEQKTGNKATINSSVRTYAEQKKMYDDWVAGGKKGPEVGKPEKSRHVTGDAVDINSAAANDMDRMGILKKYGLTRPVAGEPWHTELAGPINRNRNNMSGVNYNAAGYETQATSQRFSKEDSTVNGFLLNSKKLDELIALQRQSNALETKILQHTKQ